jgi:hypothetical protein
MTPEIPEDSIRYGCPECWPSSDATAAWNATGRLRFVVEVSDRSHFHQRILVCEACSQKFLRTFYEEVDFEDGDDPQYLVVVPITPAEEDTLLFRDEGVGDRFAVGKNRRVVRKDSPKGDPDGVIRWGYGYRLKPDDD